jgi:polyhydroxybutyrate depolymerase
MAMRMPWAASLALVLFACSSEDGADGSKGNDGGSSTGGSMASGGTGNTAAVGGTSSSGGSGAGGTGAGGGMGGSGGSGTGGTSGAAGAAGAAGSGGGPTTSTGCGSVTPRQSGTFNIDMSGTSREYILELPDNYDSDKPHILVFGWHWRGGNAEDVAGDGFYGLEERANGTAIFVAPQGLVANGTTGWANPNGRDIAFTEAMLARFREELCIDESRIFSTGFSFGGMMSFAVGCALGDVFRAIAPIAGALYSGCVDGTAPVALWGAHGYSGGTATVGPDGVVPIDHGRQGRDEFLQRNGCGTETVRVEPDECVAYQGCRAGYPVTWCEWDGGHWVPGFAGQAIWDFFSQF